MTRRAYRPTAGSAAVRCLPGALGFLLLWLFLALSLSAQPNSSPLPPLPEAWFGQVQCVITLDTPGYTRQETHTWSFTGAEPTSEGAFRIHEAKWSVSGRGSLARLQGSQRIETIWTVDVPPTPVKLATFIRASDQKLMVRQWKSLARLPRAMVGSKKVSIDGQARPDLPVSADATEWSFGWIEVDKTQSELSGTKTVYADALPAEFAPSNRNMTLTATCTWRLSRSVSAIPAPAPRDAPASHPPHSAPPPAAPAEHPAPSLPAPPPFAHIPEPGEPDPSRPSDPPFAQIPDVDPLPGSTPPAATPASPPTSQPRDESTSAQRIAGVFLTAVPPNVRPWILLFGGDGQFASENLGKVLQNPAYPARGRGVYELQGQTLLITFQDGTSAKLSIRLEGGEADNPQRVVVNGIVFEREKEPPPPLPPAFTP